MYVFIRFLHSRTTPFPCCGHNLEPGEWESCVRTDFQYSSCGFFTFWSARYHGTGEPGSGRISSGDELHRQATVETSREPLVEPNAQDDHGMTMGQRDLPGLAR